MTLDSINHEQGLYVIQESAGYSCLGFEVAYKRAQRVYAWLVVNDGAGATDPPHPQDVGSEAGYEQYSLVMLQAAGFCATTKRRCPAELHPQLRGLEGKRVEVVDADGETRRFWVGRSIGWLPIHLEIARSNSSGGLGADSRPYRSVRVLR